MIKHKSEHSEMGIRRSFINALIVGVVINALVLPNIAASQSTGTSGDPKFVRVGDENDFFRPIYVNPNPCDIISHNVTFCREGTDWLLENQLISNEQALYKRSEDERASITVIWMSYRSSENLSPAEVDALLTQHIFQNGPRGSFIIEAVLSENLSFTGRLIQRTSIVRQVDGQRFLHKVTVLRLDYGLSFDETTLALSDTDEMSEMIDEQALLHKEVLSLGRISTRIIVRR